MPLPFILAGLGALASGAAAVGTAAVGTAVAVGGAALAAGGAVAGTLAALGAITIAGVSLSTIVACVAGLWLFTEWNEFIEEEGQKEGYKRASREYEAKLNRQAELFLKELNDAKSEIESHKIARSKAERFAKEMARICGEYEGMLQKFERDGRSPLDETLNYSRAFKELKKQAA